MLKVLYHLDPNSERAQKRTKLLEDVLGLDYLVYRFDSLADLQAGLGVLVPIKTWSTKYGCAYTWLAIMIK